MSLIKLDDGVASRLSNRVRLKDVAFQGLQAEHVAQPESVSDTTLLDWKIPTVAAFWEREGQQIHVLFPFHLQVDAIDDKTDQRTRVVEIRVNIRLQYEIATGEEESITHDLPHFVGVCGYMHAWPYLRAEVHLLTGKIGLPPLVLPTIVSGDAAANVTLRRASEIRRELQERIDPQLPGKPSSKSATRRRPPRRK